jgi:predicted phage terminase large subunit-like protein
MKAMEIDLQTILHDRKVRKKLAIESHYWFFHIYLSHYVKYPTAPFHREIFRITEDNSILDTVIVSFRGSAKSTIMTLSYPLWAMVGRLQKKCIVVASLTQNQSKTLLYQMKQELETNELFIEDFGPFVDQNDGWRADSLVIGQYDTRILAISANESIRGIRHGPNRPDLIICDDVEDLNSVKTQEGRDKTFQWFTGELIPMGDKNTKVVVIGNLLHEDSLVMRLREESLHQQTKRLVRLYPLLDEENKIAWPGKYPTIASVYEERAKVGNIAFQREYLLTIIPDTDVVVRPEWIHYYDELPNIDAGSGFQFLVASVDLAISEKQTADYTAIVYAYVFGIDKDAVIYILPTPINRRMSFPTTVQTIMQENQRYQGQGITQKWYVEDVAYQKAAIQELHHQGLKVHGVKVQGSDKRARLSQTTSWLEAKRILFPPQGAEVLINQLLGFGVERHDDLADAFSMLVLQVIKDNPRRMRVFGQDSDAYKSLHDI